MKIFYKSHASVILKVINVFSMHCILAPTNTYCRGDFMKHAAFLVLSLQITYNMVHPSKISHNFESQSICVVPVSVILHSTVSTPLEVKVNTLGTSTETQMMPPRHELSNPQPLLNFRWVGHSEFLVLMEEFTSKELSLMAAFTTPGTYDLAGRLEILCRIPKSPFSTVMQETSFDSSIIIQGVR